MPLKDPAARRAYNAQYRAANRERKRAYERACYAVNREGLCASKHAYRAANRERYRALGRAYAAADRDGRRLRAGRRRARKLAAFVEDVHVLVVLERDDGECGICGEDVDPFEFHIDHIVPLAAGGEHSYANTQVAHPQCNMRKGASV